MDQAGVKPLITDDSYPEGLNLENVVDIVRLHLGICAKHDPLAGPAIDTRASGLSRSSSVRAEGQEKYRELQAKRKEEAVNAVEEAQPVPPIPAITPRAELKRFREESSVATLQAVEQPPKPTNRRLDLKVIYLISEDGDAVMTDAESRDS